MVVNRLSFSHYFSFGILGLLALGMVACSAGKGGSGGVAERVTINGTLNNCTADSMTLYSVNGPFRDRVAAAKIEKEAGVGKFSLEAPLSGSAMYAIGENPRAATLVLLGDAEEVELTGNCQNPQESFVFTGSALQTGYSDLIANVIQHNTQIQQLRQNLQIFSQTDPSQISRIQQDLKNADDQFFAYLDSTLARTDLVGKIAKMYDFRPFGSRPEHSKYASEIDYFVAEFFEGFDPNDKDIQRMPQLFEKAQAYAANISSIMPGDAGKQTLDQALAKAEVGSDGYKNILRGYLVGLEQRKSDLFITYSEAFLKAYPEDPSAAQYQAVAQQMSRLQVGSEAPDIADKTPAGETLALSDLRGQYVLIDFWASWCRPCRMENPNVVKAYNKYHGAGFEILGVSLDQKRDKWLQAIEADALPWKHISDLGGWQSQPAAAYSVNSIPATYLVDKDGKIIAKNLRGQALEAKLNEIFGF